ncbi:hypothetical protein HAX54_046544, partial [Datura stramonium]|nr:hypothetical protein [Datura stramonium]
MVKGEGFVDGEVEVIGGFNGGNKWSNGGYGEGKKNDITYVSCFALDHVTAVRYPRLSSFKREGGSQFTIFFFPDFLRVLRPPPLCGELHLAH